MHSDGAEELEASPKESQGQRLTEYSQIRGEKKPAETASKDENQEKEYFRKSRRKTTRRKQK